MIKARVIRGVQTSSYLQVRSYKLGLLVITHVRGLITPLITTHEPTSLQVGTFMFILSNPYSKPSANPHLGLERFNHNPKPVNP